MDAGWAQGGRRKESSRPARPEADAGRVEAEGKRMKKRRHGVSSEGKTWDEGLGETCALQGNAADLLGNWGAGRLLAAVSLPSETGLGGVRGRGSGAEILPGGSTA